MSAIADLSSHNPHLKMNPMASFIVDKPNLMIGPDKGDITFVFGAGTNGITAPTATINNSANTNVRNVTKNSVNLGPLTRVDGTNLPINTGQSFGATPPPVPNLHPLSGAPNNIYNTKRHLGPEPLNFNYGSGQANNYKKKLLMAAISNHSLLQFSQPKLPILPDPQHFLNPDRPLANHRFTQDHDPNIPVHVGRGDLVDSGSKLDPKSSDNVNNACGRISYDRNDETTRKRNILEDGGDDAGHCPDSLESSWPVPKRSSSQPQQHHGAVTAATNGNAINNESSASLGTTMLGNNWLDNYRISASSLLSSPVINDACSLSSAPPTPNPNLSPLPQERVCHDFSSLKPLDLATKNKTITMEDFDPIKSNIGLEFPQIPLLNCRPKLIEKARLYWEEFVNKILVATKEEEGSTAEEIKDNDFTPKIHTIEPPPNPDLNFPASLPPVSNDVTTYDPKNYISKPPSTLPPLPLNNTTDKIIIPSHGSSTANDRINTNLSPPLCPTRGIRYGPVDSTTLVNDLRGINSTDHEILHPPAQQLGSVSSSNGRYTPPDDLRLPTDSVPSLISTTPPIPKGDGNRGSVQVAPPILPTPLIRYDKLTRATSDRAFALTETPKADDEEDDDGMAKYANYANLHHHQQHHINLFNEELNKIVMMNCIIPQVPPTIDLQQHQQQQQQQMLDPFMATALYYYQQQYMANFYGKGSGCGAGGGGMLPTVLPPHHSPYVSNPGTLLANPFYYVMPPQGINPTNFGGAHPLPHSHFVNHQYEDTSGLPSRNNPQNLNTPPFEPSFQHHLHNQHHLETRMLHNHLTKQKMDCRPYGAATLNNDHNALPKKTEPFCPKISIATKTTEPRLSLQNGSEPAPKKLSPDNSSSVFSSFGSQYSNEASDPDNCDSNPISNDNKPTKNGSSSSSAENFPVPQNDPTTSPNDVLTNDSAVDLTFNEEDAQRKSNSSSKESYTNYNGVLNLSKRFTPSKKETVSERTYTKPVNNRRVDDIKSAQADLPSLEKDKLEALALYNKLADAPGEGVMTDADKNLVRQWNGTEDFLWEDVKYKKASRKLGIPGRNNQNSKTSMAATAYNGNSNGSFYYDNQEFDDNTELDEYEYGDKIFQSLGRPCNKDQRMALALSLPFSIEEIVTSPIDNFSEILRKADLSIEQIGLVRDIRRRGKNKIAAQNCRKRKLDLIMFLGKNVDYLKATRSALLEEREELEKDIIDYHIKLENLYIETFDQKCRLSTSEDIASEVNVKSIIPENYAFQFKENTTGILMPQKPSLQEYVFKWESKT